eukprot:g2564.t1
MTRLFLLTIAFLALIFAVVSAESVPQFRGSYPWYFRRRIPYPPRKPRGSSNLDPCENCAACLAIDYFDRPGELVCDKCDPGYILENGYCIKEPCICPAIYAPVCGYDGKTYSNSCEASCGKVEVECEGPCPCKPNCACTAIYAPVCGYDGKTYSNSCEAKCAGAKEECDGECPCKPNCACPEIYSPVCGYDGKTYSNSCEAKCAGAKEECDGECPCKPSCVCPKIYAPVCGYDGKTYSNSCLAKCAGTKAECDGECPCKPSNPPIACPRCAGNPCEDKGCWKYPRAKCRLKYCSCEAEFVYRNRVVDCDDYPPSPVCPYGLPLVQCFADPCQVTKCEAYPYAECRSNYCGGCNAEFFVNGRKVDCEKPVCGKENSPCQYKNECCDGLSCCMCPPPFQTPYPYYPVKQGFCTRSILHELRASWSRKLIETDKKPQQNDEVDLISYEYGTQQAQPIPQAAPSRAYPAPQYPRSTQELLQAFNHPPSGPYGVRGVGRGPTASMAQPRVYHFINQSGLHNGMAGFRPQGVSGRIGGLKVSPSTGGGGVFVPGLIQGNNAFHGLQQNHEMLQTRPQVFGNLHLTNSNEFQLHTDPALVPTNFRPFYQRAAGKRKELPALSQFNNDLTTTAQSIKAPRLADDTSAVSRRIPQRDGGNDEGPSAQPSTHDKELDEEDVTLSDVDDEEEPSEYKNCLTAQYEKVARTKNRWRCTLKHGIFSVDGQDYLFKTATGEFTF